MSGAASGRRERARNDPARVLHHAPLVHGQRARERYFEDGVPGEAQVSSNDSNKRLRPHR